MNRFLQKLTVFVSLLLFASYSQATNYYTLTSGNYANAIALWSTDGITPCGCNPGTSLTGSDSIFIRHDLDLTTLSLENGATLTISSGINVIGTGSMTLLNASAFNNGNFSIASITSSESQITSNGILEVTAGNFLNIVGTVDITGYASVAGSYRNINFGTLILRTNSSFNVASFFFNIGTTVTEPGSCINVGGDFQTPEIGSVLGDGHISAGFNIISDGFWDANTSWCAGVSGFGLPIPPNCINCGPLPVTLASFEAIYRGEDRSIDIQWTTSSEINNDYFVVEHSTDGSHYEEMARVESKLSSGISGSYELTDTDPAYGINYYRLRQVDRDGSEVVLETTSLFVNDAIHSNAQVYPNPSNGPLNYTVSLEKEEALNVSVLDIQGSVVFELILPASGHHQGMIELGMFPAGTYLVKLQTPSFQSTKKILRF